MTSLEELLRELDMEDPLTEVEASSAKELAVELGGMACARRISKGTGACPFVTGITYVTEGDDPVTDGVEDHHGD